MSQLTRRRMLLGAAATVTAGAGAVVLGAPSATSASGRVPQQDGADDPLEFDEVYRGRRISARRTDPHQSRAHHRSGGHHRHAAHRAAHHAGHEAGHDANHGYLVTVDGRELHIMRNADGTWVSVVNHYETFTTLRPLARAAVDELQGAVLVPLPV